jgi:hypothetical protein
MSKRLQLALLEQFDQPGVHIFFYPQVRRN